MPKFAIATPCAAAPSKRRRILVADDDLTQIIAESLNSQPDMRADTARDDHEALALMSEGAYDAIILNARMPHMTALEVLRQLRAVDAVTPVIDISASGKDEIPKRLDGLTFDDSMAKPFMMPNRVTRVDHVIALHHKRAGVSR